MQSLDIRPLSAGEKLDVAIKIYWRNALTLYRVVLIVVVPVQVLTVLVFASALPESTFAPQAPLDPTQPGFEQTPDADAVWTSIAAIALVYVLQFVASTLATAACFKAVTDAYLGERPHWRSSLAFAGRRFPSVLWITLLQFFAAFGIMFAAIFLAAFMAAISEWTLLIGVPLGIAAAVVAIWLWGSWLVSIPAFFAEETKGRTALARSFRLVKGRWWRTIGLYVLASLLATIVAQIFTALFTALLFTPIGESTAMGLILNAVATTAAAIITTPFIAAVAAVLYFDLRVRKEGFDLQLLAERIGLGPDVIGRLRPMPEYRPLPPQGPGTAPPFWPPPPGWTPQAEPSATPPPAPPPSAPGPSPYSPEGFAERDAAPGSSDRPRPPMWPPPPGWTPEEPRDR